MTALCWALFMAANTSAVALLIGRGPALVGADQQAFAASVGQSVHWTGYLLGTVLAGALVSLLEMRPLLAGAGVGLLALAVWLAYLLRHERPAPAPGDSRGVRGPGLRNENGQVATVTAPDGSLLCP